MYAPGRKPAGITGGRRGLAERVAGETDLASGPGWSAGAGVGALLRAERRAGRSRRGRERVVERAERGEATWAGRGGRLGCGKEREWLGPRGVVVWAAAR